MIRYYVAPQYLETLLETKDKNDRDARYKAALSLAELINECRLSSKLPNGFSTRRLIEIKREDLMSENEEEIIHAVKVLTKLSHAKQKTQELYDQAQVARQSIDFLFADKRLTSEELEGVRQDLKIIESFARANSCYREAVPEAEIARSTLDKALETSS